MVAALQRRNNTVEGNPSVGCVRLHGAVHGDERGAFREIARQLCEAFGLEFLRSASFEDNLRFLQKLMKDLSRCVPSVHRACAVFAFKFWFLGTLGRHSRCYRNDC